MAEKQNPRRGDMESTPQRGLHREISQRALQMSYSFPSKVCVGSFIGGICFAYIFHFFLPSFRTMEYGLTFTTPSVEMVHTSSLADISKSGDCDFTLKDMGTEEDLQRSFIDDERVSLLYSAWSDMLNVSEEGDGDDFLSSVGLNRSSVPKAPHMENCELSTRVNQRLDSHGENGSFPPWTIWKGLLGLELLRPTSEMDKEQKRFERLAKSEGAYPPWIVGSDEDNYPLTRKVQHDIWVHQHPLNCSDSQVRFLVADWERLPGLGIGAQFAGMCGLLAIAIKEKRVLVTNYYNRADHDGCQGPARSHWSCYFFPETSIACRDRALELVMRQEAWETGTVTGKDNYTSKEIWAGRVPRVWGNPWDHLQPTTDIDGSLVIHHRKMDRRWWRAQAIRYLMRFRSQYTCNLLNIARHEAFGSQAAKVVLGSLITDWQEAVVNNSRAGIEQFVWSNHEPWIPRPILSMHVRMGDKASEMKVVGFEEYMRLAERIRKRFPNLNNIWLSTEMQEVIDKSRLYTHWNFYYTNVTRQVGNIAMAVYEASLSRETSTNYPLVNFLMATEADFFIGALGSTWCFLIDSMRNTGGKVMAGYLSVNKDRFW